MPGWFGVEARLRSRELRAEEEAEEEGGMRGVFVLDGAGEAVRGEVIVAIVREWW